MSNNLHCALLSHPKGSRRGDECSFANCEWFGVFEETFCAGEVIWCSESHVPPAQPLFDADGLRTT